MAYKFQVGEARLSGSLVREGDVLFKDSSAASSIIMEVDEDGDVNIQQHNGSDTGLKLADALVTSTAAELNLVDGSQASTVVNSKALIYGSSGEVVGTSFVVADDSYMGAVGDTDMLQFDAGNDLTLASDLDFIIGKAGGLQLADGAVNSTAAELNLLDGSGAGSVVNSKGVIYSAGGQVNGTSLSASSGITGSSLQMGAYGLTNAGALAISAMNADWTNAGRTVADLGEVTTVDINGGSLDGVTIGAASAADATVAAFVATGDVDLGNATSDTITATGRFDSDLVPSSDSARDLGSSALRWSTIYVDSIVGADIAADTENYGAAPYSYSLSASVDFALLTTAAQTYTLPAASAGKKLDIKLSGSIHTCTIVAASNDSIEGGETIILESTGSAISLVAMDATHWFIV